MLGIFNRQKNSSVINRQRSNFVKIFLGVLFLERMRFTVQKCLDEFSLLFPEPAAIV